MGKVQLINSRWDYRNNPRFLKKVVEELGLTPSYPCIRVTGLCGKSSIGVKLAASLHSSRTEVGFLRAPFHPNMNKAISVGLKPLSTKHLYQYSDEISKRRKKFISTHDHFFLMALMHFKRRNVSLGIFETLHQDLYDPVNALDAELTVVSPTYGPLLFNKYYSGLQSRCTKSIIPHGFPIDPVAVTEDKVIAVNGFSLTIDDENTAIATAAAQEIAAKHRAFSVNKWYLSSGVEYVQEVKSYHGVDFVCDAPKSITTFVIALKSFVAMHPGAALHVILAPTLRMFGKRYIAAAMRFRRQLRSLYLVGSGREGKKYKQEFIDWVIAAPREFRLRQRALVLLQSPCEITAAMDSVVERVKQDEVAVIFGSIDLFESIQFEDEFRRT